MRVVIGANRGVYNRIPEAFRMRVVIGANRGVYNTEMPFFLLFPDFRIFDRSSVNLNYNFLSFKSLF